MSKHFFFNDPSGDLMTGVPFKNHLLKKRIILFLDQNGTGTIADISKKLRVSVPKMNNLIQELSEEGLIRDLGKVETEVGRRPQLFGLTSDSTFFLGVDVKNNSLDIGLMNFQEELIEFKKDLPFELENTEKSLDSLCKIINDFLENSDYKGKVVRIGLNLSGRVNRLTGFSHNFFNFHKEPLSKILKDKFGILTYIENDTRAQAFAEFRRLNSEGRKNILYINADYGLGMGALINGQLQYGKSGYSGEFGHIPFFENEIICRCGKKGCLETEASGRALVKIFRDKLNQGSTSVLQKSFKDYSKINMSHIIKAAKADDMLSIELIGMIGSKLGKGISTLIHLYNPELIIFGGALSTTGDHFFLPLQMAINKFSLNLVKSDTLLEISKFGEGAGVLGACFLAKEKLMSNN